MDDWLSRKNRRTVWMFVTCATALICLSFLPSGQVTEVNVKQISLDVEGTTIKISHHAYTNPTRDVFSEVRTGGNDYEEEVIDDGDDNSSNGSGFDDEVDNGDDYENKDDDSEENLLTGKIFQNDQKNDQEEYKLNKAQAKNRWSLPPGAGVDLKKLDQCLKHQVDVYLFNSSVNNPTYDFEKTPIMTAIWNNYGSRYIGGDFGSSTVFAISKSKHLAYMMNPKVGSTTFRELLGRCDNYPGQPCDVNNTANRPWQAVDAHMSFRRGFFRNNIRHGAGQTTIDFQPGFDEMVNQALRFTFVEDPITKFIGAFIQVKRYSAGFPNSPQRDQAYLQSFLKYVDKYTSPKRIKDHVDPHFAPMSYYVYNAALEATTLARQKNPNATYAAPFDFIGRLDGNNGQADWTEVLRLVEERYPGSAKLTNPDLPHTNGGREQANRAAYNQAKIIAKEKKLATLAREVMWSMQHRRAKRALAEYSKVETMPAKTARKLCAVFYSEYICFGLAFPAQCTDAQGNFNVTEYPIHARKDKYVYQIQ